MPGRMGKRPILHSIKHVLDTEGSLVQATPATIDVATTVVSASDPFKPGDVVLGSKVFAIFITIFIIGSTGAPVGGSQNWLLGKLMNGQPGLPAPSNVGVSPLRNQVYHQEKGLVGSGDGTAMAFKGVLKIPRGQQTMREGQKIQVRIENLDPGTTQFCFRAIYKSWI